MGHRVHDGDPRRVAVRDGLFDEGARHFAAALEGFGRLRADQDAAVVEAFLCERLAFTGDFEAARHRAERLLAVGGAGPRLVPLLERVRAAALAASARVDEAEIALRAALDCARRADDPYETAVSLYELAMLDRAAAAERRECDALLDRLGVVRVSGTSGPPARPGSAP